MRASVDAAANVQSQESNLTDVKVAEFTERLFYATGALAVVACVQAILFLWQLGLMRAGLRDAKDSADAARDAAKAAGTQATAAVEGIEIQKTSMISGERAYVFHGGIRHISHAYSDKLGLFWSIRPTWTNLGNTPAREIKSYVKYELLDEALPNDFAFVVGADKSIRTPLAPRGGGVGAFAYNIDGSDLNAVQKGTKFFYVWGVIRYRDVFEGTPERITKFCVQATNITGDVLNVWDEKKPVEITWAHFERHNCADDDCE